MVDVADSTTDAALFAGQTGEVLGHHGAPEACSARCRPSRSWGRAGRGALINGDRMGRIVYAAAMSHVLYPDYYGQNVGPHGRRMVEDLIAVVRDMGRTLLTTAPDALVVVADDHLNVFSFDAIPALCVRVSRSVNRMV